MSKPSREAPATDASNAVEKITRGDELAQGRDLAADNRRKLADLFPGVLTETAEGVAVDAAVLAQLVGAVADDDRRERFGLSWHGKSAARRLALTPSTGTLRPAPEESVDWETTGNVLIEGDNLEVLKLLQKAYSGVAKVVYIDPPYNTGNDFIYEDDFSDSIANYKQRIGEPPTTNPDTGRRHTNWLNMIFPRALLARELLRDDGVLFVSIDEVEIANLRIVLDDIFGAENRLGTVVWKNATDNNPSAVVIEHEYILVYAKNSNAAERVWRSAVTDVKDLLERIGQKFISEYPNQDQRTQAYTAWFREHKDELWPLDRYKYIDDGGIYTGSQSVHNPGREGYRYDVPHPKTGRPCKQPLLGYRFPWESMKKLIAEDRLLYGDDENKIVELKVYAREFQDKLASVFELDGRLGAYDFAELFPEAKRAFTNPKPVRLLRHLLSFVLNDGDLAIDFFAGSGSLGHAVLQVNESLGGNRRYLLVQLPEKTDRDDYATIAKLTAERLRRAGERVRKAWLEQLSSTAAGSKAPDTGFRIFKLDAANVKAWEAPTTDALKPETIEQLLQVNVDAVRPDRSEADLLWGAMLNLGLPLDGKVITREIDGNTVYVAGGGTLLACFAPALDLKSGERLATGLAAVAKELGVVGEITVLLRDAAFAGNDAAKVNLVENLKQRMPDGATARVRSI